MERQIEVFFDLDGNSQVTFSASRKRFDLCISWRFLLRENGIELMRVLVWHETEVTKNQSH